MNPEMFTCSFIDEQIVVVLPTPTFESRSPSEMTPTLPLHYHCKLFCGFMIMNVHADYRQFDPVSC